MSQIKNNLKESFWKKPYQKLVMLKIFCKESIVEAVDMKEK